MLASDLQTYRSPRGGSPLRMERPTGLDLSIGTTEIEDGCLVGDDAYEVVGGIPRFCPRENYAGTFGFQWNHYDRVQLDSVSNWGGVSERRLFEQTQWPRDLRGERVLEAGCGMGRFTQHLLATGADVWSFDYSTAVEANARNNGARPNLHLSQADIYHPPFAPASFDRVLCIGVLQHTPDPGLAFDSLVRMLRPGGSIAIDCYRLDWRTPFLGKYWARPLTRRLRPATLQLMVRAHLAWVYPMTGALQRVFGGRARALSWLLAVADYRGIFPADQAMLRELAELDTFDMLSPAHDHPQTLGRVRQWFERNGLTDVRVRPGWNGIEGIGRKSS
jgi:SAM-dependent methyltransferase